MQIAICHRLGSITGLINITGRDIQPPHINTSPTPQTKRQYRPIAERLGGSLHFSCRARGVIMNHGDAATILRKFRYNAIEVMSIGGLERNSDVVHLFGVYDVRSTRSIGVRIDFDKILGAPRTITISIVPRIMLHTPMTSCSIRNSISFNEVMFGAEHATYGIRVTIVVVA